MQWNWLSKDHLLWRRKMGWLYGKRRFQWELHCTAIPLAIDNAEGWLSDSSFDWFVQSRVQKVWESMSLPNPLLVVVEGRLFCFNIKGGSYYCWKSRLCVVVVDQRATVYVSLPLRLNLLLLNRLSSLCGHFLATNSSSSSTCRSPWRSFIHIYGARSVVAVFLRLTTSS